MIALLISKGGESRIHSINHLLASLPEDIKAGDQMRYAAKELDKLYSNKIPGFLFYGYPERLFHG